jgi:hypothetical protein
MHPTGKANMFAVYRAIELISEHCPSFEANLMSGIDVASLVNYDDKISFWNRSMPWYLLNPLQNNLALGHVLI